MVLAIALNFRLLQTIGLRTIHAAVRLRSGDNAFASRIGASLLALSGHFYLALSRTFATKSTHPSEGE